MTLFVFHPSTKCHQDVPLHSPSNTDTESLEDQQCMHWGSDNVSSTVPKGTFLSNAKMPFIYGKIYYFTELINLQVISF